MAMHSGGVIMPHAIHEVPAAPRLHQINNTIIDHAERIRARAQNLSLKADAIIGCVRSDGASTTAQPPTPAPNGALEQIEMALDSLGRALGELAAAERRFGGLA